MVSSHVWQHIRSDLYFHLISQRERQSQGVTGSCSWELDLPQQWNDNAYISLDLQRGRNTPVIGSFLKTNLSVFKVSSARTRIQFETNLTLCCIFPPGECLSTFAWATRAALFHASLFSGHALNSASYFGDHVPVTCLHCCCPAVSTPPAITIQDVYPLILSFYLQEVMRFTVWEGEWALSLIHLNLRADIIIHQLRDARLWLCLHAIIFMHNLSKCHTDVHSDMWSQLWRSFLGGWGAGTAWSVISD